MKRIILIFSIFSTASCFGQTACNSSNPIFMFDNTGMPKDIPRLGTAPEFPFLRNKATPEQVAAAIKRNDREHTRGMSELNNILMAVGFTNGAKDVDASSINPYYMPVGTEGNMGSAGYSTAYCKLTGNADNYKAWKITSGTGCYVYLFAKCGNAFYPKNNKTACINVPVKLTGDMKEVTLNSSGQKSTTTNNVYVYYEKRRHKRHAVAHPIADIPDAYPSTPLLLNSTEDVETIPETYKVSLNTPDNNVTVCPDSTLNLTANINVEKTSEYSGYYPNSSKNVYKKVSKHAYRMAARKMRKVKRKEERVARRTGISISECELAAK